MRSYPPWQPPQANLEIRLTRTGKDIATKAHNKLFREIFNKSNNEIFYTDGSEIDGKIGAAVVHRGANRKWNLGTKVDNYDAELWAIQKALEWAIEQETRDISRDTKIWIFSDSQECIRLIEKNYVEQYEIHMIINHIASLGGHVTIQWVPGHMDIAGNESADKAAKESLKELSIPDTWISISYIRRQIRADTKRNWTTIYNTSKQAKHYQQLDRKPGDHRLKWLKGVDRLIFSTIQQLTLGHGYFRSYTGMIEKKSRDCTRCHVTETPRHLLSKCRKYDQERGSMSKILTNSTNSTIAGLSILLATKKGVESTIQYIRDTRVATRKWILGQIGIPEDDSGGWGTLERD